MTQIPRRKSVVVTSVLVAAALVVAHEAHTGTESAGLGVLLPLMFLLSVLGVTLGVLGGLVLIVLVVMPCSTISSRTVSAGR